MDFVDCPFLTDWIGTTPTFTIRPIDSETTEVRFHHQGLNQELECIDMCARSWADYIASLRDYLETVAEARSGARAIKLAARHKREIPRRPSTKSSDRCGAPAVWEVTGVFPSLHQQLTSLRLG